MYNSKSLFENQLNKKLYQVEFPCGSNFHAEHMHFEIFDKLYINDLEIKFAEYIDDTETSYNKIAINKRILDGREGVSNNGMGKFLVGHKILQDVLFYGFVIDGINTKHAILLKFSAEFNVLIDAALPFAAEFYFVNSQISERLKDLEISGV